MIEVQRAEPDAIEPMRDLHRQAMASQIISDSYLRRGFSDVYLIQVSGRIAGYVLVAMKYYPNTVNEFFVLPEYRGTAQDLFLGVLKSSGAARIRAQSNDPLLHLMLHDFGKDLIAQEVLFGDGIQTALSCPNATFRRIEPTDGSALEERGLERDDMWMLEVGGLPVGTGGVLTHYNPPFGDLYMAVHEPSRRRGYGAFIIQELKRVAYEMGRIPAARCNHTNVASRRTLQKGGMHPCGRMIEAAVDRDALTG